MSLAALLRQGDLVLTLTVTQPVFLRARVVAMAAGNAFLVKRRGDLLGGDRVAAGVAEPVFAFLQTVLDGHALVEDEAGAIPEAFSCGTSSRYFRMPPFR